jgi:hypothetical protein
MGLGLGLLEVCLVEPDLRLGTSTRGNILAVKPTVNFAHFALRRGLAVKSNVNLGDFAGLASLMRN